MEGGSLLAQVQAADAESAQALADYAQVVLDALLEVEQALSREASLKLRQQQIKEQLKQTQWTEDALEADYTAGLIDFDVYQQGKLSTLDTQEKLKLNHHQVWDNRIQLYLALGQPAR
jgi:outer membrane protein TolC